MLFMGVVLKAEKEKDEDGVPVTAGEASQAVFQRFIFPCCKHSISKDGECLFLIGTGANLCLTGT